ncbi:MAG: universal stress protein [Anaerolineales bacterium]|nr:universal stress protein [Anaerolineales bacterium]
MFKSDYIKALDDYKKARRGAAVQELIARLVGNTEDAQLLSYDEVRQQLQAIEKNAEHLEEIPLDAIVGSVGRYHDFTRKFLPKSSINEDRWARVMASSQGLSGLPAIEVYRIGEVYFVRDGNHRVSVARQMGNTAIQAYVTNVEIKVDLTPDFTPDDLIIKSEQVKFLEKTRLDRITPNPDLSTTKAGAYPTLLEHIEIHRYYLGLEKQQEIPYENAAANWYKEVFLPVEKIIQKRDLLCDFPDRTATDLYLWAADHRTSLEQQVGWDIGAEAALTDLSDMHSQKRKSGLRVLSKAINWLIPNALEKGPPVGTWREKLDQMTILEHLFNDLIVAIDDSSTAWQALDQAIILSKLENSSIHAVHIHPDLTEGSQDEHSSLEDAFTSHCQNARVSNFDFMVAVGEISKVLCDHARFADIILLPLNHPPGNEPIKRLSSGITSLIRNCSVPILTVPAAPTSLKTILLAYDGSIKAKEALFIAAYFGSQHGSTIKVLTSVIGIANPDSIQEEAKIYLARFPLNSQYIISQVSVSEQINIMHQTEEIDLILIGGYSGSTLIDVMLGSAVDKVLREIQLPILICR